MFFTEIDRMMQPGIDLNITISKLEGLLTVALMPRTRELKDSAKEQLTPLILTGSPQDMDVEFFNIVLQPVAKATELLINLRQFEQSAEQVRKSSQSVKSAQSARPEPPKEDKATREKREKYEKHLRYGERLESEGNFDGAMMQYRTATVSAPNDEARKVIEEKIKGVQTKASEGNLFGNITSPPQSGQQAAPQQQASSVQSMPQSVIPQQSIRQQATQTGLFGEQSVPQAAQAQQPAAQPTLRPQPQPMQSIQEYPQGRQSYAGIAPNTADFPVPQPQRVEPRFAMPATPHPAEIYNADGYSEDPDDDMPEDSDNEEYDDTDDDDNEILAYGNASGF